jgi:hypothetical protein
VFTVSRGFSAGASVLNQENIAQASAIGYIDDFKFMFILTVAITTTFRHLRSQSAIRRMDRA